MNKEEAILYLEHTGYDDFNLEDWQIKNRLEAIKFILKENKQLKERISEIEEAYETQAEAKYYDYIDKHESKLQQENEQLKDNWNNLKEHIQECLNEALENDVYDRTSYEQGIIAGLESSLFKLEELENGGSNE